jgi:hypothetical protein
VSLYYGLDQRLVPMLKACVYLSIEQLQTHLSIHVETCRPKACAALGDKDGEDRKVG